MVFTYANLLALRDLAQGRLMAYPPRPELGNRTLTPDEARELAWFEAAVLLLNRLGAQIPEGVAAVSFNNEVEYGKDG